MTASSLHRYKQKIRTTIPLFKMYANETDIKAVTKVIRRQNYWATGEEITKFENELTKFVGKKYAVVFNSGTSALHAMLLAYGIKEKDYQEIVY